MAWRKQHRCRFGKHERHIASSEMSLRLVGSPDSQLNLFEPSRVQREKSPRLPADSLLVEPSIINCHRDVIERILIRPFDVSITFNRRLFGARVSPVSPTLINDFANHPYTYDYGAARHNSASYLARARLSTALGNTLRIILRRLN